MTKTDTQPTNHQLKLLTEMINMIPGFTKEFNAYAIQSEPEPTKSSIDILNVRTWDTVGTIDANLRIFSIDIPLEVKQSLQQVITAFRKLYLEDSQPFQTDTPVQMPDYFYILQREDFDMVMRDYHPEVPKSRYDEIYDKIRMNFEIEDWTDMVGDWIDCELNNPSH